MEHGVKRGYRFDGQAARHFETLDFGRFDYILAMDEANLQVLKDRAPENFNAHLGLLLDFAPDQEVREVPDPYYSGAHGFERVLDLIEAGCTGLITHIKSRQS